MNMRYRMPAEWSLHQRMFMEWPVPDEVWCENFDVACEAFAQVARAIAKFEPVTMIINPGDEASAHALCGSAVELLTIPHDDCWLRDNGCSFVAEDNTSTLHGIHWRFNAWGNKYPNQALDTKVPTELCRHVSLPEYLAPIVLEGGSIHTNGRDTLLTTSECLLNPNRNPEWTQEALSGILCSMLGVSRVIYLPYGISYDETDGHIDNMACFLDENTVLLPRVSDKGDANFDRIESARRVLSEAGLAIRDIVHPPLTLENGQPLALSYVNFVFVNGGIVMPGFGGELAGYDARAKAQLSEYFPDREIVQVMTRDIVRGGGNIHCITQQMPASHG
jgi:agmatine deiminase